MWILEEKKHPFNGKNMDHSYEQYAFLYIYFDPYLPNYPRFTNVSLTLLELQQFYRHIPCWNTGVGLNLGKLWMIRLERIFNFFFLQKLNFNVGWEFIARFFF